MKHVTTDFAVPFAKGTLRTSSRKLSDEHPTYHIQRNTTRKAQKLRAQAKCRVSSQVGTTVPTLKLR